MTRFYTKSRVSNAVKPAFGNFLNVLIPKHSVLMFRTEPNVVSAIFSHCDSSQMLPSKCREYESSSAAQTYEVVFSIAFASSFSNLSDFSPWDSCLKRLHFALRFWNQVFTCRSVNPRTFDSCLRSGGERYFWFSKIFSSSIVCSLENRTWPPFFFCGLGKKRFQAPKSKEATEMITDATISAG